MHSSIAEKTFYFIFFSLHVHGPWFFHCNNVGGVQYISLPIIPESASRFKQYVHLKGMIFMETILDNLSFSSHLHKK